MLTAQFYSFSKRIWHVCVCTELSTIFLGKRKKFLIFVYRIETAGFINFLFTLDFYMFLCTVTHLLSTFAVHRQQQFFPLLIKLDHTLRALHNNRLCNFC